MSLFRQAFRNPFRSLKPLPAGAYNYQTPPEAARQYRLHLRLEPDGKGLLIVNAATVLHLNQTAAEYAYHLVRGSAEREVGQAIADRYRIRASRASEHYRDLKARIETLISTPDLDPEIYLDFDRRAPYSSALSAPYRLDCALTYKLPAPSEVHYAPVERVRRELSAGEWQTVLEKAWNAGIPHVVFTGGEPTERIELADLIGTAQRLGQVTGLLTDGIRLAEREYMDRLLLAGLDHLTIALEPDSRPAWKAIENAVAAEVYVAVHLTVTPENASAIPAVLDRLASRQVKAVSLSSSSEQVHPALHAARNHAAKLGLTLVWDLAVPYSHFNPVALESESKASGAGHAWLYVEPDGDVLPAQGVNQVLGNLLNDPWESIWSKAKAFHK